MQTVFKHFSSKKVKIETLELDYTSRDPQIIRLFLLFHSVITGLNLLLSCVEKKLSKRSNILLRTNELFCHENIE